MANTIKLKRGSGSDPSASDLAVGEVALRTDNAKLFTKNDAGNVAQIGGGLADVVDDTTPQLGGDLDVNTNNIIFGDSGGASDDRLTFGAGTDLSIYHNGTDSAIVNSTGDLYITNNGDDLLLQGLDDVVIKTQGGADVSIQCFGNGGVELYADNNKRFETSGDGATLTGNLTVSGTVDGVDIAALNTTVSGKLSNIVEDTSPQLGGNLDTNDKNIVFGDSDGGSGTDNRAVFGASQDLKIYHDGSNSYIVNTTNDLIIWDDSRIRFRSPSYMFNNAANDENIIIANENSGVELYFNNVKKFESTVRGVEISGNATNPLSSLSDGSTITVDFGASCNFTVTLGGNRTFGDPDNTASSVGSSGSIFIVQDGTGSRTASFHSDYKFAGGTAPTLSTTANAVDRLDYIVRAADNVHCVVTLDVK